VSPPELPAYAPVVDVVQPMEPHFLKTLGQYLLLLFNQRRFSSGCQICCLDKPLTGEHRLDDLPSSLAARHSLDRGHFLHKQAQRSEVLQKLLPAFKTIQTGILECVLIHGAILVEDADEVQAVLLAQGVVVGVVAGRHLQHARPELHVHVVVANHYKG
jgi:hypothetical protein